MIKKHCMFLTWSRLCFLLPLLCQPQQTFSKLWLQLFKENNQNFLSRSFCNFPHLENWLFLYIRTIIEPFISCFVLHLHQQCYFRIPFHTQRLNQMNLHFNFKSTICFYNNSQKYFFQNHRLFCPITEFLNLAKGYFLPYIQFCCTRPPLLKVFEPLHCIT